MTVLEADDQRERVSTGPEVRVPLGTSRGAAEALRANDGRPLNADASLLRCARRDRGPEARRPGLVEVGETMTVPRAGNSSAWTMTAESRATLLVAADP